VIQSFSTPENLIEAAAKDFASLAQEKLKSQPEFRVLLTGGTLGIEFIKAIGKLELDWGRVWLMFSDERFVPLDHADRNEQQGISAWPALENYLTRFSPSEIEIDQARQSAEDMMTGLFGQVSNSGSVFDLTVLGMGPDAHVASLFPGHQRTGGWVISETDSPKPPSSRLSLSYEALNRSERVWFLAAGESKAWAVAQSMAPQSGLPAAKVRGLAETVWYLDQEITDAL
jgi:6-phosphogluconolactonase